MVKVGTPCVGPGFGLSWDILAWEWAGVKEIVCILFGNV